MDRPEDSRRPDARLPAVVADVSLADLDPRTLRDVYDRLLAPVFRPDELMTLDEIRQAYVHPGGEPSVVVLVDGTPRAVMMGEWYADHRVLLLAYLSVDGALRGSGVGARLVGEVLPGWCAGREPVLVLAEVEDPRAWAGSDVAGDPRARLRFYDRLGGQVLPLRYVQPSLRDGSPRVDGMLLLRLDRSPGMPASLLRAFLEEYVTACEGAAALDDPPMAELLAAVGALDLDDDARPAGRWAELPWRETR